MSRNAIPLNHVDHSSAKHPSLAPSPVSERTARSAAGPARRCTRCLQPIQVGQPDPSDLRRCLRLDQEEAQRQLEQERLAWEAWADEPIDPFLTIRYIPAVYGVREVPRAFCTPRDTAEDNAWAWDRAEDWAAAELKRFRAKGFLSWSRRERTWFDKGGLNPSQQAVTFEDRHTGAWMQVSGSQLRLLLGSTGELITSSFGLDQPA